MRYCVACGGANSDDAAFCFNCGAPLAGNQPQQEASGQVQQGGQVQMQPQPSFTSVPQSFFSDPASQSAIPSQQNPGSQAPFMSQSQLESQAPFASQSQLGSQTPFGSESQAAQQQSFSTQSRTYQPTQIQTPSQQEQVVQQPAQQLTPQQPMQQPVQQQEFVTPTSTRQEATVESFTQNVPSASQVYTPQPAPMPDMHAGSQGSMAVQPQQKNKSTIIIIAVVAIAVVAIVGVLIGSGIFSGGGGGQAGGQGSAASAPAPAAPAIQVNPKSNLEDYSWEELKAISNEIAAASDKAEALKVAAKYNLAAADGTLDKTKTKSVTLTDGVASKVRIIGIYHDDVTNGGKAGLTFQFTDAVAAGAMNTGKTNTGGWEQSEMRSWLANDFKSLLPSDLSSQIASVDKKTNNTGEADDADQVTTTSDQIWLLAYAEVTGQHSESDFAKDTPNLVTVYNAEGTQYQLYREMGITYEKDCPDAKAVYVAKAPTSKSLKTGSPCAWWHRSAKSTSSTNFACTTAEGRPARTAAANDLLGVVPAFCL